MKLGFHWASAGALPSSHKVAMIQAQRTGMPAFYVLLPIVCMPWPMDFRGFMNIVGPKGKDGFGGNTYWEILARPQLQLDVGKMLFNKPHVPDVYLAVEFWQHKFGNPTQLNGSEQIAPMIGMEVHF